MKRKKNDYSRLMYVDCGNSLCPSSITCMYNNGFDVSNDGKIFWSFGCKGYDTGMFIAQLRGDDLNVERLMLSDIFMTNRLMYNCCDRELYFCDDREL